MAMDQDAVRALDRHPWPGNVRELENCVRRAVIMAEGKRLTVKDLELVPSKGGALTNLKDARENLGSTRRCGSMAEKSRLQRWNWASAGRRFTI
jgi:two-component system NtrC family response regulator